MTRIRLILPLAAAALLAACSSPATTPSSEAEPSAVATASVAPSVAPSDDPPSELPSEAPSATPEVTPPIGGGFEIAANPAADALFLTRDQCENRRDGYQLQFPDEWYTNTEYRNFAPCVWFSPDFYETDGDTVPPEIAITIEWVAGVPASRDAEVVSEEEGEVGLQAATRTEWDDDTYRYVIQLGPTVEDGPNLVVTTSDEMGGDYELNKAVLDRILATIEFIGSTQ